MKHSPTSEPSGPSVPAWWCSMSLITKWQRLRRSQWHAMYCSQSGLFWRSWVWTLVGLNLGWIVYFTVIYLNHNYHEPLKRTNKMNPGQCHCTTPHKSNNLGPFCVTMVRTKGMYQEGKQYADMKQWQYTITQQKTWGGNGESFWRG